MKLSLPSFSNLANKPNSVLNSQQHREFWELKSYDANSLSIYTASLKIMQPIMIPSEKIV